MAVYGFVKKANEELTKARVRELQKIIAPFWIVIPRAWLKTLTGKDDE